MSSHSGGSHQFLSREFTLWDKSMGDPLQSDNTDSSSTQKKKNDGRLASGQYTLPFSFPFPTHPDPGSLNTSSISPFPPRTVGTTPSSVVPSPLYNNDLKSTGKAQWTRRFSSSVVSTSSSTRVQASDHSHISLGSEPRRSFASPLPQTFMEKDINPNVAYEISVRIAHGRFKASSK
jgi:hypothetical protein